MSVHEDKFPKGFAIRLVQEASNRTPVFKLAVRAEPTIPDRTIGVHFLHSNLAHDYP